MTWRRLRTYRTLPEAHLALNELLNSGMGGELRGVQRAPLAGEVPFADARLELWVLDEHLASAEQLLADIDAANDGDPRPCPRCKEENPPAFEVCWQCGTSLG